MAVEEPTVIGAGLPADHFASRSRDVLSVCLIAETERSENLKVVYDSPNPNSKRGVILFASKCR